MQAGRHSCFLLPSAGSTCTLLVILLVAVSAAQAQGAADAATPALAPATNASAAAPSGADSPLGGAGFITVQGNKFVDANCKVSPVRTSDQAHTVVERSSAGAGVPFRGRQFVSTSTKLRDRFRFRLLPPAMHAAAIRETSLLLQMVDVRSCHRQGKAISHRVLGRAQSYPVPV